MQERMRISSVNVGAAEQISHDGKSMTTGICKRPVEGAIRVTELGLEGDAIVDQKHHGGVDQAIYVYSQDDYRWWTEAAGREFPAGLFGENLTIEGLPGNLFIGDRLLVGDVVLEATSPRIPCGTLATRLQDRGFGMVFRQAARPGVYCRVLNPGVVQAGTRLPWLRMLPARLPCWIFFNSPMRPVTTSNVCNDSWRRRLPRE